jgi:30S ribosome assembly GTPase
MITTCLGCGASLQTVDPALPGYIPQSTKEREQVLCRRCFRIRHYNEVSPVSIQKEEFERILMELGGKRALILNVVDLFDFEGSWIQGLERFIGENPLVLVANKIDLLPRQTNFAKVETWLMDEVKKKRLETHKVILVSARKGIGVEHVKTLIESYANERDIYVVGTANVGKSTLVNKLLHLFGESQDVGLTTSRYPGTTLSTVKMKIPQYHHVIVDTPGVLTTTRLTDLVSPESLKLITPEKVINPRIYQLNCGQTLFVGGLVRFDFVAGGSQSFVGYFANQLPMHRTKLENANALYEKHVGELLKPPGPDDPASLRDLVTHKFKIRKGPAVDIVIAGLGWISVRGNEEADLRVHVPRGVHVSIRKAII